MSTIQADVNSLKSGEIQGVNLDITSDNDLSITLQKADGTSISDQSALPQSNDLFKYRLKINDVSETIGSRDGEFDSESTYFRYIPYPVDGQSNAQITFKNDEGYLFENTLRIMGDRAGSALMYFCNLAKLTSPLDTSAFSSILTRTLSRITDGWIVPDGTYRVEFAVSANSNLYLYKSDSEYSDTNLSDIKLTADLTKNGEGVYSSSIITIPKKLYVGYNPNVLIYEIRFMLISFNGITLY